MLKVNNKNTRMTPLTSSGAFIVLFEHISYLFLEFLLLTLYKQMLNVKGTKFLIEKYSFKLFFSMGIVPVMEVDDLSHSAITCLKLTLKTLKRRY